MAFKKCEVKQNNFELDAVFYCVIRTIQVYVLG